MSKRRGSVEPDDSSPKRTFHRSSSRENGDLAAVAPGEAVHDRPKRSTYRRPSLNVTAAVTSSEPRTAEQSFEVFVENQLGEVKRAIVAEYRRQCIQLSNTVATVAVERASIVIQQHNRDSMSSNSDAKNHDMRGSLFCTSISEESSDGQDKARAASKDETASNQEEEMNDQLDDIIKQLNDVKESPTSNRLPSITDAPENEPRGSNLSFRTRASEVWVEELEDQGTESAEVDKKQDEPFPERKGRKKSVVLSVMPVESEASHATEDSEYPSEASRSNSVGQQLPLHMRRRKSEAVVLADPEYGRMDSLGLTPGKGMPRSSARPSLHGQLFDQETARQLGSIIAASPASPVKAAKFSPIAAGFRDQHRLSLLRTGNNHVAIGGSARNSVLDHGALASSVLNRLALGQNLPDESQEDEEYFEVLDVWKAAGARRTSLWSRSQTKILDDGGSKGSDKLKQEADALQLNSNKKKRDEKPCRLILHPSAGSCIVWNLIGLVLIGYDCVMLPFEAFEPAESDFRLGAMWVTRLYWTVNIFVTFCTGYINEDGSVETRPMPIAKRYIFTWLGLDLFVVGIDWAEAMVSVFAGLNRIGNFLRAIRMMRLVRVARLLKAPEILEFINENIRSEQVVLLATIIKIIAMMITVTHVIACAWFGLGRISGNGKRRWITYYRVDDLVVWQQYIHAFHWSLAQFAGELILEPQNDTERIFTVVVLFFCIIFSAVFVSSLTTAMTRLQIVTGQQSSHLAMLRRYLLDQSISRSLAARVQQNAQFSMNEQKKHIPEQDVHLLKLISNPLLVELHFEIYFKHLREHPFFSCYQLVNPGGLKRVCDQAVSILNLSAGDVLFSDLEVPSWKRMFFVIGGCLIYTRRMKDLKVESKEWMCEATLWTNWTHHGTAKALYETRLLELDADKFQKIISCFQTENAVVYASEFVEALNDLEPEDRSDLNTVDEDLEDILDLAFPDETDSEDESSSSSSEEDYEPQDTTSNLGEVLSQDSKPRQSQTTSNRNSSWQTSPMDKVRESAIRISSSFTGKTSPFAGGVVAGEKKKHHSKKPSSHHHHHTGEKSTARTSQPHRTISHDNSKSGMTKKARFLKKSRLYVKLKRFMDRLLLCCCCRRHASHRWPKGGQGGVRFASSSAGDGMGRRMSSERQSRRLSADRSSRRMSSDRNDQRQSISSGRQKGNSEGDDTTDMQLLSVTSGDTERPTTAKAASQKKQQQSRKSQESQPQVSSTFSAEEVPNILVMSPDMVHQQSSSGPPLTLAGPITAWGGEDRVHSFGEPASSTSPCSSEDDQENMKSISSLDDLEGSKTTRS